MTIHVVAAFDVAGWEPTPYEEESGAGYVVSERVVGRLGKREGSFVLQHWGVSGGGRPQHLIMDPEAP